MISAHSFTFSFTYSAIPPFPHDVHSLSYSSIKHTTKQVPTGLGLGFEPGRGMVCNPSSSWTRRRAGLPRSPGLGPARRHLSKRSRSGLQEYAVPGGRTRGHPGSRVVPSLLCQAGASPIPTPAQEREGRFLKHMHFGRAMHGGWLAGEWLTCPVAPKNL